jgi:molecular chaperone GrpE
VFRKKRMTENDTKGETSDDQRIPFTDKRRFTEDGRTAEGQPVDEPVVSVQELMLEAALKAETERRQAAEAKLSSVQVKFDEAKANLERETSEMRTRLMKTLEDRARQSQLNFLTTLLPVLDNLNLAVAASETDSSVEHLRTGVIGTARSFERALIDVGVEPLEVVGRVFDPELHEAVDIVPAQDEDDGRITAEYARGYKFRDKLLRPARVQVGKAMLGKADE